uniref:C2H2-type domain-containing protein n=1 Tax=Timema cristinae TaxID=61476 RepID=A0A7R9CQ60_TIMCR|nr:unnamed protein product [Timema cristinae]
MALESNSWLASNNSANRDHTGVVKTRDEQLGQVCLSSSHHLTCTAYLPRKSDNSSSCQIRFLHMCVEKPCTLRCDDNDSVANYCPQVTQQHTGTQNFVGGGEDVVTQSQQRGLLKIPSSVGKCSMFTQTEHTNRFTQTEQPSNRYGGSCLETGNTVCKTDSTTAMFDPSSLQQQQQQQQQGTNNTQQQQMYTDTKKDAGDKSANTVEFPFCYNVNMLQKVHQQQGGSTTGVPVGALTGDDKGCYRFDVAQPFGYNYALVNQMSLAAAASTFKCDVCGLVFGHLSLLNHHKRIHTSVNSVNAGTQSSGNERQYTCDICGACFNLAGELKSHKTGMHGKSHTHANHTHVKCCDSCGVELNTCEHHKGKKGKFVKCESCLDIAGSNSSGSMNNGGAFSGNSSGGEGNSNNSPPGVVNNGDIKPGHHPVKRRGMGSVTKCHKCNGSGLIFIGGIRNNSSVDKPFHCNVCDGTFSRYSSLWSHKRLHSGDKPFKCETCVHTGEKPHRCDICDVGFADRFALKRHRGIHEKYGRTAPNTGPNGTNNSTNGASSQTGVPQGSVGATNAGNPANIGNPNGTAAQQQTMEELYKCEVGGPIAFPGCSRPHEDKQ